MKNSILIFLLGVFVTISIAATTPNTGLFTVRPATPKQTISFTTNYQSVSNQINNLVKKGFIVKFISGITDRYEGQNFVTVVMEKY